ncbi:MAG: ECF transporter S component [Oscillospiraceae bacterium]|jgi:riboflavin transporter FmnP|nr:ECF transporter S component [Oscillospiraceae bacterium]
MKRTNLQHGKNSFLKTQKLVQLAVLAALAFVLVLLIRIPFVPPATFLEYDIADVPVLLAGLLFGPVPAMAILVIEAAIQAFALGGNAVYGFIMHVISSAALVLTASIIYRTRKNMPSLIIGLVAGCLAMTAVMMAANLLITPYFMAAPGQLQAMQATVKEWLLPVFLPFNLSKAAINAALTFAVFFPVKKVYEKFNKA